MEFLEVYLTPYSPDAWHPRLRPPQAFLLQGVKRGHRMLSYNGVIITPLELLLQLTIKALIPFPVL
jgi:hypothetical protein